MKLALLALVASTSIAGAAPSRAVTAAEAWLKAMIDPAVAPRAIDKGKTLPYVTDSPEKSCAKLKKGTAKTAADLKALKACFFATRDKLSKNAAYSIAERVPDPKNEGDASKWLKTAPKGTVLVETKHAVGPLSFETVIAVSENGTVIAVWMYYNEPEDTFGE